MKKYENLIADYLVGALNKTEEKHFEKLLREDDELRNAFFEMQHGIETEVIQLDDSGYDPQVKWKTLGATVKSSRAFYDTPLVKPILSWGGWAVAAMLVVGLVLIQSYSERTYTEYSENFPQSPTLAVFDMPLTQEGAVNKPMLKKVIYSNESEGEVIDLAQLIAEQMYQEMSETKTNPDARGFLIVDIQGKQGYVGLSASETMKPDTNETVEIYDKENGRKIELVSLPADEMTGDVLFYFQLEDEQPLPNSPQMLTPYVKVSNALNI